MKLSKEAIQTALENVMDPEMGISIVDLGLIYEININGEKVHIVMTLTTLGCPLYGVIDNDMKSKLQSIGIAPDNIEIELVFDPPWNMDRMSESAKAMLGI